MPKERSNPPALPHTAIDQLFDDVHLVTGTFELKLGFITLTGSRNMAIVRDRENLTLINSLRLNEAGLEQLDALGKVENIVRLAAFHGMDDPFYKERYGAKVWSVNAPYVSGFASAPGPEQIYFEPDVRIQATASDSLPIRDSLYIEFGTSTPREAVLFIEREGGIVISGDCFQNARSKDPFTNTLGRWLEWVVGFLKPYNIGPGWYRQAKPDPNEIAAVLDRGFEHLLPVHGEPVIGNASQLYRAG